MSDGPAPLSIESSSPEKFWVSWNGSQEGPFTRAEMLRKLANGEVQPTDYVFCEGAEEWLPAISCELLQSSQVNDGSNSVSGSCWVQDRPRYSVDSPPCSASTHAKWSRVCLIVLASAVLVVSAAFFLWQRSDTRAKLNSAELSAWTEVMRTFPGNKYHPDGKQLDGASGLAAAAMARSIHLEDTWAISFIDPDTVKAGYWITKAYPPHMSVVGVWKYGHEPKGRYISLALSDLNTVRTVFDTYDKWCATSQREKLVGGVQKELARVGNWKFTFVTPDKLRAEWIKKNQGEHDAHYEMWVLDATAVRNLLQLFDMIPEMREEALKNVTLLHEKVQNEQSRADEEKRATEQARQRTLDALQ